MSFQNKVCSTWIEYIEVTQNESIEWEGKLLKVNSGKKVIQLKVYFFPNCQICKLEIAHEVRTYKTTILHELSDQQTRHQGSIYNFIFLRGHYRILGKLPFQDWNYQIFFFSLYKGSCDDNYIKLFLWVLFFFPPCHQGRKPFQHKVPFYEHFLLCQSTNKLIF